MILADINNPQLLYDLARKVSMYEPKVSVLNDDIYDQYLLTVRAVDSCLKSKLKKRNLALPELRNDGNKTIAIYSDYGGESKESAFYTYSFLVCGWNHAYAFPEFMDEIREKYGLGKKEISFKDLKYGPISRSLDEYLTALHNWVPGILVTLVVDKQIKSVFGDKIPDYVIKEISDSGFGEWKPHIIEKLMRVVHCAAYLVALLSKDGQNIYWNTDHDAIVANSIKQNNFINLFNSVLTLYTNNKFARIGYSTPFEERNMRQIDFLSCADLAAGAVEHYFTKAKKTNNPKIKKGADKILSWLGNDGLSLKKLTVLVTKGSDNGINVGEVVFDSKKSKKEKIAILVPTRYKI